MTELCRDLNHEIYGNNGVTDIFIKYSKIYFDETKNNIRIYGKKRIYPDDDNVYVHVPNYKIEQQYSYIRTITKKDVGYANLRNDTLIIHFGTAGNITDSLSFIGGINPDFINLFAHFYCSDNTLFCDTMFCDGKLNDLHKEYLETIMSELKDYLNKNKIPYNDEILLKIIKNL